MRIITKDITLTIDGSPQSFRLTKPDAFSGVEILRLLLRLQNRQDCHPEVCSARKTSQCARFQRKTDGSPVHEVSAAESKDLTILDLITSFSSDELRSVMTSCLNHVSVLLPAGPNPVMTGSEWGYPELKHDTVSCMKLMLEEIAWALEGFFGVGGSNAQPASQTTSP